MSDDNQGNKTEKATPRKLEKAREQGDVPRTKEIAVVALLTYTLLYFILNGDNVMFSLRSVITGNLSLSSMDRPVDEIMHTVIWATTKEVGMALIKFLWPLVIIAAFTHSVVGGFLFTPVKLKPKLSNISPAKGIKKIFSMNQLVELVKGLLKAALVLVPIYFLVEPMFYQYSAMKLNYDPKELIEMQFGEILVWALIFSLLYLLVAFIDIPYQFHAFAKKHMMTVAEVIREFKDIDGNPEIKAKRKQMQMEISRKAAKSNMKAADLVLINPTHYSVGIKWKLEDNTLPQIVALGADNAALAMRATAAAENIPVYSIPILARVLYRVTEPGDYVPHDLLGPMSQVLGYIYSLDDKLSPDITQKFIDSLGIVEENFLGRNKRSSHLVNE